MSEPIAIDQICSLFLETVRRYDAFEKNTHLRGFDPDLHLSEIHTIVAVNSAEALNITLLAQKQGVSKSAVSQMVSKLVKKGFLVKRTSPQTDNEVVIELTEAGQSVCMEHEKQHQGLRQQLSAIFARYPPETMDSLTQLAQDLQQLWSSLS